jgi:hypothetical protein
LASRCGEGLADSGLGSLYLELHKCLDMRFRFSLGNLGNLVLVVSVECLFRSLAGPEYKLDPCLARDKIILGETGFCMFKSIVRTEVS